MTYLEKLKAVVKKNNSNLVIGLDSDITKIPKCFHKYSDPVYDFNHYIMCSTKDIVAGYKLNMAFYESVKGYKTVEKTLKYIPDNLIKICDAKRGDIGNTDEMYARSFLDEMNFDAITFQPYMGYDSLEPFINRKDKLTYVLALTSNEGSNDFQKLKVGNKFLYEKVVEKCIEWNKNKNIGFVFGSNYVKEIGKYSKELPDYPLLIPGVGSQHGEAGDLLKNLHNKNFVINSSRGIIYSSPMNVERKEFEKIVRQKTIELNNTINKL
ncbi:MAG: orotidine-5'-phosphate decarboxylase [Bacteroidetes bacterium]|nr:orotidine-5'-phosphate decarboxylase [Bacteroidota bacterium]